eukprot:scaffold229172_cov23-Tisochrysis_lutea.AAC.1
MSNQCQQLFKVMRKGQICRIFDAHLGPPFSNLLPSDLIALVFRWASRVSFCPLAWPLELDKFLNQSCVHVIVIVLPPSTFDPEAIIRMHAAVGVCERVR